MGIINCKESRNASTVIENETVPNVRLSGGEEFIEKEICNANDLLENEMKEYNLTENQKILLIKKHGNIVAIGNKCTHYGAPLIKGVLGENRIRCPWHGACFNLETGDIEDFPGLDSIPCYKVMINPANNQVRVRAKKSVLEHNKRVVEMEKRNPCDDTTYVIVGGGPSSAVCAEKLRQEGFTGRIVMICKENALPYDRVKISKNLNVDLEKIELRNMKFYEEHEIEIMKCVEVNSVNTVEKQVTCSNGYVIKYDKLYIATGSSPRKLYCPGSDLGYIMTLRDHADQKRICELLKPEMDIVCLGGSFISLESAASLVSKAKSVSVIFRDDFPLIRSFGEKIGERVLKLFEEKGVKMIKRSGISECIGEGVIKSVKLVDGSIINCDMLIVGIGSKLNTELLEKSCVNLNKDGSVDTDMHLMSNVPDIYIGGDIANAPVYSNGNLKATIGHYQLAQYHGKVAALNMVGKATDLKAIPFFFTMLFGKGIRYAGYGKPAETQIEGSLEDMSFIAIYYDKEGNVIAMASCNRDPIVAQFAEFQSQGKRLHKNDIKNDLFAWTKLIQ